MFPKVENHPEILHKYKDCGCRHAEHKNENRICQINNLQKNQLRFK